MDEYTNMQAKESHLAFKNAFEPFAEDSTLKVQLQRKMEKLAVETRLMKEKRLKAA